MTPSERAIREARESSNRAIVAKDADTIASLLADDYHVVTALNSQRSGREESHRAWAEVFVNDPGATFERVPSAIDVNEELGMAHENGHWTGTFRAGDAPVTVSGVYAAKWQRQADSRWVLLAELFTPLNRP